MRTIHVESRHDGPYRSSWTVRAAASHGSRTAALILAVMLSAGVASAGDHARSGAYVSIAGIYVTDLFEGKLEDELSDAFGPVNVDIDPTPGFTARAGVRFLRFLALEAQYDWLREYRVTFDVPGLAGDNTRIDVQQQTLTANLRVNLPLGRVQPYALAGIGFQLIELDGVAQLGPSIEIRESVDDVVLAGRLGAGIEVFVTDHVGLFVEGLFVMTDEEINLGGQRINEIFYAGGGAGLTYRF